MIIFPDESQGFATLTSKLNFYYPKLACIIFTHDAQMGGWQEKVCPGSISETIRCRMLILGRDIGYWCRCAMSCCDLDLTLL